MTRVALVNPLWDFTGSVYFGCREPHLPLELGYARALLERDGHDVLLVDASLEGGDGPSLAGRVRSFAPELVVITTAPTYLFWRCPPPELRSPAQAARDLQSLDAPVVAVGPHASTTPRATLAKLAIDAAILGECEEVVARLARTPREGWGEIDGVALRGDDGRLVVRGGEQAADIAALPALRWRAAELHAHHHHRFDPGAGEGLGAELEATRGCPFHCTFCNKESFRDRYRKRPLAVVLEELDALLAQGVRYVYFVDEIFLPDHALLEALAARDVAFGVQLRIDLWSLEELDLLGRAGCKSIEAGVESVSREGRSLLYKRCKLDNDALAERLIHAKRTVPFVQANLLRVERDDPAEIERFRQSLVAHGVWANRPVPLFPYPGTPEYRMRWGRPDDRAWERAHEHYLRSFTAEDLSDVQDARPAPLAELERHG